MDNNRFFLGVPPTDEVLKQLLEFQRILKKSALFLRRKDNCRWIEEKNIHLTLHFLGSLEPSLLSELKSRLLEDLSHYPPHQQSLSEFIAFPRPAYARVAGVGDRVPTEPLSGMWHHISGILRSLNVPAEDRPFHAHVTLVRLRKPMSFSAEEVSLFAPKSGLKLVVDRVNLFQSFLAEKGARYEIVQQFPLAATSMP